MTSDLNNKMKCYSFLGGNVEVVGEFLNCDELISIFLFYLFIFKYSKARVFLFSIFLF